MFYDIQNMKKKTFFTILGFVIFALGFLALIMSLVNLKLSILSFIDKPGRTFGFVVRLVMIFGGMVMLYVARTENRID